MSGPVVTDRIAVVGGGITGLSAAHRLHELAPERSVTLFESSSRIGGVLQSEAVDDGLLIEHSADMFITKQPWAIQLCQRIGLDEELLPTNDQHRRSFVAWRGRLEPIPEGFTLLAPTSVWPILKSRLLSWPGKVRMGYELFVPPRKDSGDESLADFARRRLGMEAFERLIQPLIGGIYTADPEKLSMQATMANFVQLEQEKGGLIRGMRLSKDKEKAAGARYGAFVAPRHGIQQLTDALAARLPAETVQLNSAVQELEQLENGLWRLKANDEQHVFSDVILATPSSIAARLLTNSAPTLSKKLAKITRASAAVVVTVFQRDQIAHPLNGFGFVVPHIEDRPILACSFSSIKFDGRANNDRVILRTFVGGACHESLLDQSDEELIQLVRKQLGKLLGVSGEPGLARVMRWHDTMPQYHVGHLELVDEIEALVETMPGLNLAGNSYRGVGIPFCVRSGEAAAAAVARSKQTTASQQS